MQIDFVDADAKPAETTALAVLAFEDGEYSPAAEALDKQLSGALKRAVAASRFKGQAGQTVSILAPTGVAAGRVLVVGAGKQDAFDARGAESAGAHAFNAAKDSGSEKLLLLMPPAGAERQAHAAFGIKPGGLSLRQVPHDREVREEALGEARPRSRCADTKAAAEAYKDALQRSPTPSASPATSSPSRPTSSIRRNTPGGCSELTSLGLEIEVLGDKEMKKLGMGSLLGVGQGSVRESQLVVMQWKGAKDASAAPIAFVGKGVCFDTGGISLKPADGMEEMITDMARLGRRGRRDVRAGRAQGQGQRRRHPRPGREHAGRQRPAAGRRGHLDVRPDHRGDQHRRRGPPRAGRRALVLPGPLQAASS